MIGAPGRPGQGVEGGRDHLGGIRAGEPMALADKAVPQVALIQREGPPAAQGQLSIFRGLHLPLEIDEQLAPGQQPEPLDLVLEGAEVHPGVHPIAVLGGRPGDHEAIHLHPVEAVALQQPPGEIEHVEVAAV